MNVNESNLRVAYLDFVGFEHTGVIVLTQPCAAPDVEETDEDGEVCYLYIRDDNPEFNDKTYTDPTTGQSFQYADIRRSTECIPIYKKEDLRDE